MKRILKFIFMLLPWFLFLGTCTILIVTVKLSNCAVTFPITENRVLYNYEQAKIDELNIAGYWDVANNLLWMKEYVHPALVTFQAEYECGRDCDLRTLSLHIGLKPTSCEDWFLVDSLRDRTESLIKISFGPYHELQAVTEITTYVLGVELDASNILSNWERIITKAQSIYHETLFNPDECATESTYQLTATALWDGVRIEYNSSCIHYSLVLSYDDNT